MNEPREPLIDVKGLEAWYGKRRILSDVDFRVEAGEIRVIMGGSGRARARCCATCSACTGLPPAASACSAWT